MAKKDQELIDAILGSAAYNAMFDEILDVGFGKRTNETESNMEIFHIHRLLRIDRDNMDRDREKRNLFLNIAAQVKKPNIKIKVLPLVQNIPFYSFVMEK